MNNSKTLLDYGIEMYAELKVKDTTNTIAQEKCFKCEMKFRLIKLKKTNEKYPKNYDCMTFGLDVKDLNASVKEIKDTIFKKFKFPPSKQVFDYFGKTLDNNYTLGYYNIVPRSLIFVIVKP